jgi:prophage tail gpP-like protein
MAGDRSVPEDQIAVDACVRSYHRADRYRCVTVTAPNAKYLEELGRKLEQELVRRDVKGVNVGLEVCAISQIGKHRLEVSIWPRSGKPLSVSWH